MKPGFRPGFEQVCDQSTTKKVRKLVADLLELFRCRFVFIGLRQIYRQFSVGNVL